VTRHETHPARAFRAAEQRDHASFSLSRIRDRGDLGIHPAAVPIPSIAVGVSIQDRARNAKLAPTKLVDRGRPRLERVAAGPFISSTHASTDATCPSSCALRGSGCHAQHGATGAAVRRLDAMGGATHQLRIADQEARLIDDACCGGAIPQDGGRDGRSGRDLRLCVAGDYTTDAEAQVVAGAAERWEDRGGGGVFAFTHGWRNIDRRSFGPIRSLASVERPSDIVEAHARGYDAAIVLPAFASDRAFELPGTAVKSCRARSKRVARLACAAGSGSARRCASAVS
jgi:hypothetical protein